MDLRTCVSPEGGFIYGTHQPSFAVKNLRGKAVPSLIGQLENGEPVDNRANFPTDDVEVHRSDTVYEIPNPFPFKGTSYISKYFADIQADNPKSIMLPPPQPVSLAEAVQKWSGIGASGAAEVLDLYGKLPEPLRLALATTSTDPEELSHLADMSCRFVRDKRTGLPVGIQYREDGSGRPIAVIHDHTLYKALANNAFLPAPYREVMVLRPGAQGASEIVGEWRSGKAKSHVYEYFRRNSYIPWGHYAANMADDAIRYHARELTRSDMAGMRHLYYQRTYLRLAEQSGIPVPFKGTNLETGDIEALRRRVLDAFVKNMPRTAPDFTAALWGWNYGFDYTPAGYRMNGSHQQVHQQYALIPASVGEDRNFMQAFACGDLIQSFVREFRRRTGKPFFECYIRALRENRRMDGRDMGPQNLVVHEDDNVFLFVPKAQTSQWELQVMARKPVGNILEADTGMRESLDFAILAAIKILSAMGAKLVTGIEYGKRFNNPDTDQRLIYSFLPRLPQSPGAFSEAQLRWINRHFPEDFAAVCRERLREIAL